MAGNDYDLPYRTGRRDRPTPPPGRTPHSRMGMHDFSERYGRYSGGDPYSYEYSERTVEHQRPRHNEGTGFTRELTRRPDRRRAPRGAPWSRRLHRRRAREHGFDTDEEGRRPVRHDRQGRRRRWYEPRDPW